MRPELMMPYEFANKNFFSEPVDYSAGPWGQIADDFHDLLVDQDSLTHQVQLANIVVRKATSGGAAQRKVQLDRFSADQNAAFLETPISSVRTEDSPTDSTFRNDKSLDKVAVALEVFLVIIPNVFIALSFLCFAMFFGMLFSDKLYYVEELNKLVFLAFSSTAFLVTGASIKRISSKVLAVI